MERMLIVMGSTNTIVKSIALSCVLITRCIVNKAYYRVVVIIVIELVFSRGSYL